MYVFPDEYYCKYYDFNKEEVTGLLDNIMSPEPTKNQDGIDVYYSRFDAPLLEELVEMADEVKEGTEIAFEPDTELGDITNWNKD